jgi:hypothetical protein
MSADVESLRHVKAYLQETKYPEGYTKDEKRRIREKAQSFRVNGDNLYHTVKGKPMQKTLVIFNEGQKQEIMEEMHSGIVGGCHYGQTATIAKVSARFWWPGMSADVRAHVRSCLLCQKANPVNKPESSTLHPIAVKQLFHMWGIDLVGPLKETPQGNKYIVVATEYLSKWVEAKAIVDKSAEEVHSFLLDLVFRFGAMNVLLHDQGREFNNNLVNDLCAELKTSVAMTSAYHPQTNGLVLISTLLLMSMGTLNVAQ